MWSGFWNVVESGSLPSGERPLDRGSGPARCSWSTVNVMSSETTVINEPGCASNELLSMVVEIKVVINHFDRTDIWERIKKAITVRLFAARDLFLEMVNAAAALWNYPALW